MAALDFPDAPAVGDLYGSLGTVWRWDGTRWASTTGTAGARGRVAYAQTTTSQASIPSMVATDLAGLSATWVADPSRTYLITGVACFKGGPSGVELDVYNGANRIQVASASSLHASYITSVPVSVVQTGLSGTQTRKLTALGLGAVCATQQGPDYPAYIMVEDITYEGNQSSSQIPYALGVVAKGTMVVVSGGALPAATATAITNTLTFTPQVGRRYRARANVRALTNPTGSGVYLRLVSNNAAIILHDNWTYVAGSYANLPLEVMFDGNGVSSTWRVDIQSGTAVAGYFTDQQTSFFYIEDVGPVR